MSTTTDDDMTLEDMIEMLECPSMRDGLLKWLDKMAAKKQQRSAARAELVMPHDTLEFTAAEEAWLQEQAAHRKPSRDRRGREWLRQRPDVRAHINKAAAKQRQTARRSW
jgi:hypothetical protein